MTHIHIDPSPRPISVSPAPICLNVRRKGRQSVVFFFEGPIKGRMVPIATDGSRANFGRSSRHRDRLFLAEPGPPLT
jgi:hypothetical protein